MAKLPGLQMLDGRAVGPEEPQQALQALRHEGVLMALMLSNACLVHKLVCSWIVYVKCLSSYTHKTQCVWATEEAVRVGPGSLLVSSTSCLLCWSLPLGCTADPGHCTALCVTSMLIGSVAPSKPCVMPCVQGLPFAVTGACLASTTALSDMLMF